MYVVPSPLVIVSTPEDQIVGQTLILQCDITTVRGIISKVRVVWSSDGIELERIERLNVSSITNNSVLYTDWYAITLLNTADEGRTFECTVVITALSPVMATDSTALNVTGNI